ncbi:hypothetical protein [uncultured Polaribacter sp.]|uniref:hypothetical protein n=1 Tax=uncultured Polaribacter sp. TaxID=174711 RepID=UPI00260744C0|nr:hypothetical protein [uncultured Polaribacter sp.]
MNPAIVIIGFNRPKSLKNVLSSISSANYLQSDIPLVISIDYQDSIEHDEVVKLAENFNWKFGNKRLIIHKKNLGLKEHVLSCGDLTNEYGSVIMLEDDLFVSPYYYTYSKKALEYYESDVNIAGVSLYNHKRNFINQLPFELISDSSDVYFLQIASSWGQAWTKNQWSNFRTWFSENKILSEFVPNYIINWPDTSWLKHFINYLVVNDKYFVYPTKSLSTNFGDSGTNNTNKNTDYQVPVFIGQKINFTEMNNCLNIYDSFFEISPKVLKKLNPKLNKYDFAVDMYGLKPLNIIKTKYLLSSKVLIEEKDKIFSFDLELKPMVFNIIHNEIGKVFNFSKTSNFHNLRKLNLENNIVFNYFIVKLSINKFIKLFFSIIKSKIMKS